MAEVSQIDVKVDEKGFFWHCNLEDQRGNYSKALQCLVNEEDPEMEGRIKPFQGDKLEGEWQTRWRSEGSKNDYGVIKARLSYAGETRVDLKRYNKTFERLLRDTWGKQGTHISRLIGRPEEFHYGGDLEDINSIQDMSNEQGMFRDEAKFHFSEDWNWA